MSITTEQLDAMLAAATPGPWICYADIPIADPNWHIVTTANKLRVLANVHIEPGNSVDPANAALIAAAPTITAELIAARRKLEAVHGLVDAAMPFVSPVQNADYARQLRQHDALIAALAAWEAAQ